MDQAHEAMADREKKRGRSKYKNLNISRMKRFLDEIKTTSIVFEELSFGEKNKNKKIKNKKWWANCYWT